MHSVLGTNVSTPLNNLLNNSIDFIRFNKRPFRLNPLTKCLRQQLYISYKAFNSQWTVLSESEVLQEIINYPGNKACGVRRCPNGFIQSRRTHYFQTTVRSLQFKAAASLYVGSTAKVIVIPKCKNPSIADLRPILYCPSAQKSSKNSSTNAVALCLANFGSSQFGFRSHSSTCHALISLHDHITCQFDTASTTGIEIIAFDLSKAFDKLDHNVIINRLMTCKFPVDLVRWLSSYLSNRKQHVSIGNDNSSTANVSSGVPQGSVLGPALLVLVIGSLQQLSPYTGPPKLIC